MDTSYVYMWVRQDLSIPQQIVQASHAASIIGEKYHSNTSAVLCGADGVDHLDAIAEHLDRNNISYVMFYEPDISAHTAIATQPLVGKQRQPLKKFKLLQ